jgi:hypothetical protein
LKQSSRDGSSVISGPEGISTGDIDFGYESGYRFTLSGGGTWWEVEAVFAQVDDWSDGFSRTLTRAMVFDDTGNNANVVGLAPGNMLSLVNSLFEASTNPNAGGVDETLEGEHLRAGGLVQMRASSRYRDFELNFSSNRNANWYRFGIGWRNLQLNETSGIAIGGTFDAIDSADGAQFGDPTNRPNDGLSHTALVDAGYVLVSGGANGFDAAATPDGPDELLLFYGGRADNELNGIQAIFAARLIPSEVIYVEGFAKAGAYHNHVTARATDLLIGTGNDDSSYGRSFHDQKGTGAFVGSLGLRTLLPLTDYISVVTGYEALFVSGVALGTEQFRGIRTNLAGTRTFSANADDSTILHGGKVGLEVAW